MKKCNIDSDYNLVNDSFVYFHFDDFVKILNLLNNLIYDSEVALYFINAGKDIYVLKRKDLLISYLNELKKISEFISNNSLKD